MSFEKSKEISGLFEISMDEEENENLSNNESLNLIEISSKLKTKSIKNKTTKRLKTSLKDKNDPSMVYEYTPDKESKFKKLNRGSTKKSSKILKQIENRTQQPKKQLYYKLISNDVNTLDDELMNDEIDKLAKEFEEISNYKLIVE